jgi:4-hydroxy 2-oxovalerate aldolase
VKARKPYVIALNANEVIENSLINARVACHPVRLLADCKQYQALPQPLICPASMLPDDVKAGLDGAELFDYGIQVIENEFQFGDLSCTVPTGLVIAYALAIAAGGEAKSISIAGMDGYEADDPRNIELDNILDLYIKANGSVTIKAITPSRLRLPKGSVYQLEEA